LIALKRSGLDDRVYPRNVRIYSSFFAPRRGRFTAGQVSSDGGAPLLREVDRKINLLARLAGCFLDRRDPERIQHTVEEMLSQRIFGLALGYED